MVVANSVKAFTGSRISSKKRKQIRNYFKKTKNRLMWPVILLILGFFTISSPDTALFGLLGLLVGGGWFFFEIKRLLGAPSDKAIDTWFLDEINQLSKRSLERLNIDESELIRTQPVVIRGPLLWETNGIPAKEMVWKKGKDKRVRFGANAITIVHLTAHKLSSYQCDYNFLRGVPLNERDDEFHYRDVVAVSTRDSSTNYTLPDGELMKQAQLFKLSVSSGDSIKALVNSPELVKFTGGEMPNTGLDDAIRTLRKVISEKKI